MRPFLAEAHRIRALSRAVGLNPHRWGIDPHVRKGVIVADLFVAAMVVVGMALGGLRPPIWFFLLFPVPVLVFAGALIVVVSAQSRDEAKMGPTNRKQP